MFKRLSVLLLVLANFSFAYAKSIDLSQIELKPFSANNAVTLNTLAADKPIYVKMWASWCKPCMEQMPHFQDLYQEYGDKVNFVAVNIDINEKPEEITSVIERFSLTMPVWTDQKGQLAVALGLVGTPYSVLLNNQREKVYSTHESDRLLDSFLQRLAQGQQLPAATQDTASTQEQQQILKPYLTGEHMLFFTATWCDWYLADSRPAMSEQCANAQTNISAVAAKVPTGNWQTVVNHLWTDEQAVNDFSKQYKITMPVKIDHQGILFRQFNVRSLPVLLKIKDGQVIEKIENFSNADKIITRFR